MGRLDWDDMLQLSVTHGGQVALDICPINCNGKHTHSGNVDGRGDGSSSEDNGHLHAIMQGVVMPAGGHVHPIRRK